DGTLLEELLLSWTLFQHSAIFTTQIVHDLFKSVVVNLFITGRRAKAAFQASIHHAVRNLIADRGIFPLDGFDDMPDRVLNLERVSWREPLRPDINTFELFLDVFLTLQIASQQFDGLFQIKRLRACDLQQTLQLDGLTTHNLQ